MCSEQEIDTKILLSLTESMKKRMKNIKLQINQIEFRRHFTITDDISLTIKISKGGVSDNETRGTFILDLFRDKNYNNCLIDKKEIKDEIELLKNAKIETKTFIQDYILTAEKFNLSKHLKFEYDKADSSKTIDFEVKPNLDKICFIEMTMKTSKETIVINGEYI